MKSKLLVIVITIILFSAPKVNFSQASDISSSLIPISGWAVILGVALIGLFVFVRYRRKI